VCRTSKWRERILALSVAYGPAKGDHCYKAWVNRGAGSIGSVVVERLLAAGHEPIVVDNLKEGYRAAVLADVLFIEASVAVSTAISKSNLGDYQSPCTYDTR
jgi:hypothetical protein